MHPNAHQYTESRFQASRPWILRTSLGWEFLLRLPHARTLPTCLGPPPVEFPSLEYTPGLANTVPSTGQRWFHVNSFTPLHSQRQTPLNQNSQPRSCNDLLIYIYTYVYIHTYMHIQTHLSIYATSSESQTKQINIKLQAGSNFRILGFLCYRLRLFRDCCHKCYTLPQTTSP